MKPDDLPYRVSRHQRVSRRSTILLIVAVVGLVAASLSLALQPRNLRMRNNWMSAPTIRYADGTVEQPTMTSNLVCLSYPEYRGIFAVEIFEFLAQNKFGYYDPAPIPAQATARFTNPAYRLGDFGSSDEPMVTLSLPSAKWNFRVNSRSRFVERVWLRREVLWTLLALAGALSLVASTPIARHTRKLRRFKKGLCTRCAYPLPLEDEEPRCPECGMLHTP